MSGPAVGLVAAGLVLVTSAVARAAVLASRGVAVRRLAEADRRPGGLAARAADILAPPPVWLTDRLASAAIGLDPKVLWTSWWAATVVVVAGGAVTAGLGLAVVALAAAGLAPAIALAALSGRGDRLAEEALPESLESMARALRSGASLRQAVDEAAASTPAPLGAELRTVAVAVSNGTPLADALRSLEHRRPLPGVRLAVAALVLGTETGGAQARAVDGVAATIRSRLSVTKEVRALSSQARLSGLVIALAPLGFAVLAVATDEPTATFLLRTPVGLACLALGLALDGLAAWWMHRLTTVGP